MIRPPPRHTLTDTRFPNTTLCPAPRAAQDDRAEQQPQEQRPVADRPAAEREAPGARPVKQPPADRPVEAREQRIGPRRGGEQRDEAAKLAVEIGRASWQARVSPSVYISGVAVPLQTHSTTTQKPNIHEGNNHKHS